MNNQREREFENFLYNIIMFRNCFNKFLNYSVLEKMFDWKLQGTKYEHNF